MKVKFIDILIRVPIHTQGKECEGEMEADAYTSVRQHLEAIDRLVKSAKKPGDTDED